MDLITKLGGRKFWMALVAIAVATYIEIQGKGLSPTMASFLVGVVGVFHVANYAASNSFLQNKKGNNDPSLHEKIDDLQEKLSDGFSPTKTDDLRQLLVSINNGVMQAQNLTAQTGQAMVNLTQVLGSLNQRKS